VTASRRAAMRALLALALLGAAGLPACARRPEICALCRREIHREVRTVVQMEDGRRVAACCPRCARHVAQEGGSGARVVEVTDFAGSGVLPMSEAWLVEGSDETPCLRHHPPVTAGEGAPLHACYDRCMPSLIAFRDAAAARTFVADHGGTLVEPAGR
jgi:hypothetical protein